MTDSSKTVVVTGGSRGMGAEIARLFSARGWRVVLTYASNEAAAQAVVKQISDAGGTASAVRCDTRSEADIKALFASLASSGTVPDALVNNAGITGPKTRLEDLSIDVLRDVVDVNLIGVFLCCREAVKCMSTQRGGKGGVIVNMSSTGTKLGNPDQWVHYAATKGGVDVLTNGLARELAADGIRVCAVAPGLTLTDPALGPQIMARLETLKGEIPMARPGTVTEVAEGVYWLASDAASYCTGVVLNVAGGR
jgi:NAD(P)-dependent dehydrogenase (short-subunit alcohol dehydrogenase family)